MNRSNTHSYTAYGYATTLPSEQSTLGFNGEHMQRNSALYILGNGYRSYSPNLMRFLSPDSWCPFGLGGCNTYTYCKGDPINAADPSGHASAATLATRRKTNFTHHITQIPGSSKALPRYERTETAVTRNRDHAGLPTYQSAVALLERPSYVNARVQPVPNYSEYPSPVQATLTSPQWKDLPSAHNLNSIKKERSLNQERISTYKNQIEIYRKQGRHVSDFQEIVNKLEMRNEEITSIMRKIRLANQLS